MINSFVVAAGRDGDCLENWERTSAFFRTQPSFVSLRLHRAVSPDTHYRYVNVAVWSSAHEFGAAHATGEFRHLVTRPAGQDFASSPTLYEVAVAADPVLDHDPR